MGVVRAGEYRLYWQTPNTTSFMMPGKFFTFLLFNLTCAYTIEGKSFRNVMSIDRFKALRACVTFNDCEVKEDPLWRLRPLINLLKASFKMFVTAGREVSVDEASIPCRSSHARALIVYNPMKPLGKYHFRIYTAACATSWYVHAFKIHSKTTANFDDDNADHDCSDESDGDATRPKGALRPSTLRQHVLDITQQWKGTRCSKLYRVVLISCCTNIVLY